MQLAQLTGLFAAAVAGGAMNALAGGGTLLTFPALLFFGHGAIAANATSTVALLPGAGASLFGYRREVRPFSGWLKTLALPSLLGGGFGSWLLLRTPERTFAGLAPWLVLFATTLFLVQGYLARKREELAAKKAAEVVASPGDVAPSKWWIAVLAQVGIAIYGGYFGAGIGILMLAVLGFLGLRDIHAMNGLKNFFGFAINAVAALYFIARGAVDWSVAPVMILGAIAGGYGGARLARFVGREWARRAVVLIGLAVAAGLFWFDLRPS
jgi:uncharacterized membrane protein YfcA